MKIDYQNYFWQNHLVRFRAMQPEDWKNDFSGLYDSEARLMLQYEIELPPTEERQRKGTELFSNFNRESGRLMFIVETLDGVPIGAINLNSIDERNGTFSIGLVIYSDYRSKGYGTAAMELILKYAFFERRLNKYYGSVIEFNTASAAMLKKLGGVQEGIRREQIFTKGKYYDEILYGLTKDDFINHR